MKLDLEKLKEKWCKYEIQFENEEYMDVDSHTDMAFKVPVLIREIEKLKHENNLLYGRLNMIYDLVSKEIK